MATRRASLSDKLFVTLIAVLTMLRMSAPAAQQPSPAVDVYSFTNSPELSRAAWRIQDSRNWQVSFDATFANECLAESGIEVTYGDVRAHLSSSAEAGSNGDLTRVAWITQKPTVGGCHDIYSPVTRLYVIDFPAAPRLDELVLLDYHEPGETVDAELQVFRVDRAMNGRSPNFSELGQGVTARPWYGQDPLPLLSSVDVLLQKTTRAGSEQSYGIDLEVPDGEGCGVGNAPRVLFLESRTGISDRSGGDVFEWMFVGNDLSNGCTQDLNAPSARHHLERTVPTTYKRTLMIGNAVRGKHAAGRWPVSRFRIWPPQ
ncbi:MAG: hypothetical protein ACREPG_09745 [Candidatus Binatia bacterium]